VATEEPSSRGGKTGSRPRRQRGSGGLTQVRPGVWRVDFDVEPDPVTARRRRLSRQIQGSRQDAEQALARLRVAHAERRLPAPGTRARTVTAALQSYLVAAEEGRIELAPRTLLTTRSAINTMTSTILVDGRAFGSIVLAKLTWQDVEDLYGAMRERGAGSDWVRRCATVLSRGLDLARKRGLVEANPAKDAVRPRTTRTKPVAPSRHEVKQLLDAAHEADVEFGAAILVLVSTGMRRSELLALMWRDVNLDREEIHVDAAITDAGPGKGILRKPTKRSDWRDVPLTAAAVTALRGQHERLTTRYSATPVPDSYVFPSPTPGMSPWRPDSFSDRWTAVRGPSRVTIQQLRHFAATAMLDAGESYRTVADILGNSENTLRLHYDGRTDVGKRQAVKALTF
jgi:integrase